MSTSWHDTSSVRVKQIPSLRPNRISGASNSMVLPGDCAGRAIEKLCRLVAGWKSTFGRVDAPKPWAGHGCYEGGDHTKPSTHRWLIWSEGGLKSHLCWTLTLTQNQEETGQEWNVSWMLGKEQWRFVPYQLDSDRHPLGVVLLFIHARDRWKYVGSDSYIVHIYFSYVKGT